MFDPVEIALASAVYYVVLLFTMVVFQRFADIAIPNTKKLLWQVAVMAVSATVVSYVPAVGTILSWLVLLLFLRLWFHGTIWSTFMIWMVSGLIHFVLVFVWLIPQMRGG